MAQLIKLLDYISRYETNPFHYPTQYIRLKQENWRRVNELWEMENEKELNTNFLETYTENMDNKKIFNWIPFRKHKEREKMETAQFERSLPRSRKKLTQYFLNELFPFQLKWATSTISQVSFTDRKFNHDSTLKHFLQRLPDIYLLMYYPIFNVKKAPVEGELILISPVGIEIIVLLQESSDTVIYTGSDRTWTIETRNNVSKIISPVIALKRNEQIVKSILNRYHLNFSIKKTILSKESSIRFTNEPYNTSLIGKEEYDTWLEERRNLTSPLKNMQLKVVEALLRHCQTASVRRPEWESDDDHFNPVNFEETK